MPIKDEKFTIGVEEEYQIIHPETRELRSRAKRILPDAEATVGDSVQPEFYLSQIEIGTNICRTLADVREELVRLRREVISAAERDGSRIAAAGTHPFSHWEDQQLTPKTRYVEITQDHQQLAREHLIFGCHVHIGIPDRDLALRVMNHARIWIAPLLALSCNSPFWLGSDTGYASFRTEIWRRWPMAGTPMTFESAAEYDRLIELLVATRSVSDATKIYWDVRPSARFETLEFRMADVCMTISESVMVAGLIRGLAQRCYQMAVRNELVRQPRPELLRAAKWRAARFGLDAELINVEQGRAKLAREVVEDMLDFIRPSLEENSEWDELSCLVRETLARGNGATRQRRACQESGRLAEVVDFVIAETSREIF